MSHRLFKLPLIFLLALVFSSSHALADKLPQGVLKDGTLSNQTLIEDVKLGVAEKVAIKGCKKPEKVNFYVTQMPIGEVGARTWEELWVVVGCSKLFPIKIRFQEDASEGAFWHIVDKNS